LVPVRKAQRVELVDQGVFPAEALPNLVVPFIGIADGENRAAEWPEFSTRRAAALGIAA
jgi:hypothetical protein